MQVPGITIKIGAGAAVVLSAAGAAVFAWMNGDTSKLDAGLATASSAVHAVPVAAWLLAPLALTLIAATLTRFGFLQKLFGDLYKQLTDSHNQTGKRLRHRDIARLRLFRRRWGKAMPYLDRADGWLALWSGRERWSLAGFDRCSLVALVYPLAALLLVWAATNNGKLGTATILPAVEESWRRWSAIFGIALSYFVAYGLGPVPRWTSLVTERFASLEKVNVFMRWLVAEVSARRYRGIVIAVPLAVLFSVVVSTTPVLVVGGPMTLIHLSNTGAMTSALALALCCIGIHMLVGGEMGILAVVIAVAFAVAGALGGIVAGGVVGICIVLVATFSTELRSLLVTHIRRRNATVLATVTAYSALYGFAILLIPQLPSWGVTLEVNAVNSAGAPFVLLTFLASFPLVNAIADWLSLNATRAFIARMQTGATRGVVARLYLWDILVALLLTIFVYGATIAILVMMQRAGWEVDVKSILTELRDHPWSGQSTWLLTLAVTNFIPTLVHMVLWLSDGLQSRDDETREDIEQFLKSGGKDAPLQIAPTIIYVLRIQKWLERAMVLSLTLALIPLFAICVPWAAGQMLRVV